MRVISGKFKGRQLVSFEADHIRPTTDRVKETLFNKLMWNIEGAKVLDLFSGTGNLAIECISRGAEWVDMVESHPKSLEIIKENLKLLKINDGFNIHKEDAFKYIQNYSGPGYNVVLADPPFTKALGHDLAMAIGQSKLLANEAILVIEASSKERMDKEYFGLIRLDQRQFGDKYLHFLQRDNDDKGNLSRQF